ncbi:hypothetical protein [Actinomadura litoris]|uniref:hypothetical protein n=1 Tax=Actinomadura litoris TaxID=2678616 RepID=UPI001FA7457E|nr:hypothetical protein [Actinomadura litoris]
MTAGPPTDGRGAREGDRISLSKGASPSPGMRSEPSAGPTGPAWIVVPARAVALVVVLPLRLCYDLLRLVGRGVAAVFRAVGEGAAWLLDLLITRPLRWLVVVVLIGGLRLLGRGAVNLARWVYRRLLLPVGRLLAMVGRGLALVLDFVLLRPLRLVGRGLAWLGSGIATVAGWLIGVLVVLPAVLVWRYVLRPPLLGLAWLFVTVGRGIAWVARGIGLFFVAVWDVLASGWKAFASAVAWTWRLLGRGLAWLGHVLFVLPARYLFVLPARALYRHLLTPIGHGVRGTWRLSARLLRWLWRTFVTVPLRWTGRVLIVAPSRWVRTRVLRPVGHGIRTSWRVTVGDPVRAVRATVRETSREVRLTLRRTFRGH